jgi:hypothetical protein
MNQRCLHSTRQVLAVIPLGAIADGRDLPPNNSFERTRSAVVARFAVRRCWRAAQLMIR